LTYRRRRCFSQSRVYWRQRTSSGQLRAIRTF